MQAFTTGRAIAERYGIDLTVVNEAVDPTFRFMTLDWDGRIRMDPSSPYAMQRLLAIKDRFDIAFACDTDHDRHGIVTPAAGLLPPNHYLAVSIDYLFRHRPQWRSDAAVGKTVVSSALIDRVAKRARRAGCTRRRSASSGSSMDCSTARIGFAGEESAGASFLRSDGTVWTTDKDGIVPACSLPKSWRAPAAIPACCIGDLTTTLGAPLNDRVDAAGNAGAEEPARAVVAQPRSRSTGWPESPSLQVLDRAPANDAPIGGVKVVSADGWFAARPSGTENIYKVYAETFRDEDALKQILVEAQTIVDAAIADPR